MILLGDERIQAIRQETNRIARNLANDTQGDFTQADMDSIFEEGDRAIAKAQAELTAREVDKLLKEILKIQIGATKTGDDCYEIKTYWRAYLRKQLKKEIEGC